MTRYVSGDNWQPSDGVKLTPEQQTAVLINDRNIAIVAGPGTGKTEVLAQKATYLLQTGLCLSPFRILALCYKVDAASNIRERVKKRCPKDLSSRFCSLTVDSFIISLVRRFATSLPSWLKIQTDFEIVDEIDLVNYCRSANTTVFPNQYTKDVTILQGDVSKATKDIYLYAARNNFFDYNMCHTLAYYIINNNQNIKKLISKTYKYIFLDEFQDMNVRHYDILKCLFNNQYNKICAVGDFNQAIMGWAGAVPDIFNKFQNDFSSTQHLFTYILSVPALLQKCVENANGNLQLAIDEYLGVNFVKLMTTHKSKGLEFDTVFFADFRTNSWWTLSRSQTDKDEALRCFFVGLSRAKTRLFFTSPVNSYPQDIADILNDSQMVVNYNPNT